jgi:hypothetical protein
VPPAPAEACACCWPARVVVAHPAEPQRQAYDQTFRTTVDAAFAGAEAWTYAGAAARRRVVLPRRALRRSRLVPRAARRTAPGRRVTASAIKESLERALELDPHMDDARVGIGLYKYLRRHRARGGEVRSLPPACCLARSGAGLKDMETVHERGTLLRGEADYQLHWIYLWYENQRSAHPRHARTVCETAYPPTRTCDARRRDFEESVLSTTPRAPASACGRRPQADGAARTGRSSCSRKQPQAAWDAATADERRSSETDSRRSPSWTRVTAQWRRPGPCRRNWPAPRWLRGDRCWIGWGTARRPPWRPIQGRACRRPSRPRADPDGIGRQEHRAGLRTTTLSAGGGKRRYRTSVSSARRRLRTGPR